MSKELELSCSVREDLGKGASRRLRRLENKVPGIVYGGKSDPVSISMDHDPLFHQLENEAFFSSIIQLKIDGKAEDVLLKDLQRHPAKNIIMHADFLRVDKNQAIVVQVPLHFVNEDSSVGVKMQGGRVSHQANEIEIRCLPGDLPEYIEVDMAEVEVGQVVHLSDVSLPEGVVSVALGLGEEHDLAIANISAPKAETEIETEFELKEINKSTKIIPLLINIQNQSKVENVFNTFNIDTVYHAAAYKHVPLVEENICESVKNNVFGTFILAEAALKYNISNFVLISSDKAVRPTNIMGASKRLAEICIQSLYDNQNKKTKFAIVRFGNVLESSGSVIPKFKQQIRLGGPVTLTHQDVTRYFMSVTDAF